MVIPKSKGHVLLCFFPCINYFFFPFLFSFKSDQYLEVHYEFEAEGLGHAKYQHDTPKVLVWEQRRLLGRVFRMEYEDTNSVIVFDPHLQRK